MSTKTYRAVLIGCGRMGATIDDETEGKPDALLPFSHAAGYAASDRVELVAASDLDARRLAAACERYGIAEGYADYRTMIAREEPDIVSIATRPGPHAEMVIYAAEQGVPAVYCEKPLCRSMTEADRLIEVIHDHGVHFNLGVNRRYMPIFRRVRELVADGAIGALQNIIVYGGARSIFWAHSHAADMLLYLTGDSQVDYVQADADVDAEAVQGERVTKDPRITLGYVRFAGGVHGYLVAANNYEVEVDGREGKIRVFNNGLDAGLRRIDPSRRIYTELPFPAVERRSGVSGCIAELVSALDGEGTTSCPIESAAAGHELGLGWLLSAVNDGARVHLPLENRNFRIEPDHW